MASRTFRDALDECRCTHTITLRDKTTARCGRRVRDGYKVCTQHLKLGEPKRVPSHAEIALALHVESERLSRVEAFFNEYHPHEVERREEVVTVRANLERIAKAVGE